MEIGLLRQANTNEFRPMSNLMNSQKVAAVRYWKAFGFDVLEDPETGAVIGLLPDSVLAFLACGSEQMEAQKKALQVLDNEPPRLAARLSSSSSMILYRLDESLPLERVREHIGDRSRVYGPGEPITLPTRHDFTPDNWPSSVDGLSLFDSLEGDGLAADDLPQRIGEGTLLDRYSLLDAELGDETPQSLAVLGKVVLSGQATVIYAPPNSGKTLLAIHLLGEAVSLGHLEPGRCYYVNADDSPVGVHEKRAILAESNIHMLVPGMQGFSTAELSNSMETLIETEDCNGVTLVIDTLKKFTDLMDKKNAAAFGDLVRRFVLKGGTLVALAHTRKNEGSDGRLVYGGTSDIMEDFDAAFVLVPLAEQTEDSEKVVQFQCSKARGRNFEETYAYDASPSSSYEARLASVRLIEDEELTSRKRLERFRSDLELIECVREAIAEGAVQKMALVRHASEQSGASRRSVMELLERYTGEDPEEHHWSFAIAARGAKIYSSHQPREPNG